MIFFMLGNKRETTLSLNTYESGKDSIRQSAPYVGVNCHKLRIYTIDNHSEVLLSSQKTSKDVFMKQFWLSFFKCQQRANTGINLTFSFQLSITMFSQTTIFCSS